MENVLSSRFAHSAMHRKFRDPERSRPKKRMNQDKSFSGKVRQYLSRTLFVPDHVSEILERVRRVETAVSDAPKPTAQERFVAMELDVGWGPWLVRWRRGRTFTWDRGCSLGVEADPGIVDLMVQHFKDNGLDPEQHRLLRRRWRRMQDPATPAAGVLYVTYMYICWLLHRGLNPSA
jgi:hypothetical protein